MKLTFLATKTNNMDFYKEDKNYSSGCINKS